jgi:histidinol-phosphatase (PHP family)
MIDYHLHAEYSSDSKASLLDYAVLANRERFRAIAITDHLDFSPESPDYSRREHLRLLTQARAAAPKTYIALGAEFTWRPKLAGQIRAWQELLNFDYTIGSVHYLDEVNTEVSSHKAEDFFAKTSVEEAYGRYFEMLLRTAESGLFHTIGHLDICKRYGVRHYGVFDPRRWETELRWVIRACLRTNTGLELNLSGLRQYPKEPYPALATLKMAKQEGLRLITLGSDSHGAEHFSASLIQEGLRLLKEAGFEQVFYWRAGLPIGLPLD